MSDLGDMIVAGLVPWFYAAIAGIVLVILAAFGLGYWLG
jgi:hypothetical protein